MGRLGSRGQFENPLTLIDDRFSERPTEAGGSFGGESRSNSYFKGPVGWFGGVRYSSSRLPVSVLAEYNGDDYQREVTLNTLEKSLALEFCGGVEAHLASNYRIILVAWINTWCAI